MPPPVQHLVYVSSATTLPSPAELAEILGVSRENNLRDGLTGLLLYSAGTYFQALEGPPDAVERTYQRIERDGRHTGSQILLREAVPRRSFEAWEMAFYNLDEDGGAALDGFSPVLSSGGRWDPFPDEPQRAHRLLRTFRKVAALDLSPR